RLPEVVDWAPGVRVVHLPAGPARHVPKEALLPHMADFAAALLRFCGREGEYDLLHANFWMSGLVAAELKRRRGTPYVVTFHALGRVRRQYQNGADRFPDERFAIEDRVVAEADHLVAECPQDEADLLRLYMADAGRITIIPCRFDPDEMWPPDSVQARRRLGLDPDERIVLHLGRLVPRKGGETVVRGVARLLRRHRLPARLLIVGGESEQPDPALTPEIGRLRAIAAEEGIA